MRGMVHGRMDREQPTRWWIKNIRDTLGMRLHETGERIATGRVENDVVRSACYMMMMMIL